MYNKITDESLEQFLSAFKQYCKLRSTHIIKNSVHNLTASINSQSDFSKFLSRFESRFKMIFYKDGSLITRLIGKP